MSREIKFRGKRLRDGQWEYGWLVIQPDGTAYISRYFKKGEWVQVDPETVGQFVGLHDKNSALIYEGDMVQCSYGGTGFVNYERGSFYLQQPTRKMALAGLENLGGTFEIIGNVWDNPDPLEQEAKV